VRSWGRRIGWSCWNEIQKLPVLLDEVHRLIEQRRIRFVLTGSSARKLRRGGVNLLGGRAPSRTLHPFTCRELGGAFDLTRALDRGLLPSIYFSDSPREDLRAYVGTYLKEEIAAEALTRSVPAFSRFLEVAALSHGTMLNFTTVASDAQVPVSTVREYFHILEDTLIARPVPAWTKTRTRKAISTAKHYFFDVGVVRHLQHRSGLARRSPEFGEAFESYIFHELSAFIDYTEPMPLAYWRSTSNFEVISSSPTPSRSRSRPRSRWASATCAVCAPSRRRRCSSTTSWCPSRRGHGLWTESASSRGGSSSSSSGPAHSYSTRRYGVHNLEGARSGRHAFAAVVRIRQQTVANTIAVLPFEIEDDTLAQGGPSDVAAQLRRLELIADSRP